MNCPICQARMSKKTYKDSEMKHSALKCCECSFVIFYKGIQELDSYLETNPII